MATPDIEPARELADRLIVDHRLAQERVGREVVGRLAPLWQIVEPTSVDSTAVVWVEAVVPVIEDGFRESQGVADRFVRDYRQAMVPAAEPMASVEFDDFPADRTRVSVIVTGPVEVKRQLPAPDALDKGFVGSSGAAVRIVGNGGREAVEKLVELDDEAIGYARKTDSKPCYFCAMLASRGAVYKKDSFELANRRFAGEGVAKTHDSCQCTLRPVYDEEDDLDEEGEEFWRIWEESTEGLSGAEERKAFRRAYENRDRPELRDPENVPVSTLERVRQDLLDEGFAEDSFQVGFYDRQIERFGGVAATEVAVPADLSELDAAARLIMHRNELDTFGAGPELDAAKVEVESLGLSASELKRAEMVARNEANVIASASTAERQADLIARSHEGLQLFAADKDVAVNVPNESVLEKILDDGKLRTQRDPGVTETGGGTYDPAVREIHENAWFGDHDEPPVYGYLRDRSGKSAGADDYGDIALILKPAVNATVTVGDSLDDRVYTFPGSIDNPGRYTANPVEAAEYATAQEYAEYLGGRFYADMYVEAQIHGGVSVADIASLHFKGDPPSGPMIERLRLAGIAYTLSEVQ